MTTPVVTMTAAQFARLQREQFKAGFRFAQEQAPAADRGYGEGVVAGFDLAPTERVLQHPAVQQAIEEAQLRGYLMRQRDQDAGSTP